MVRDVTDINAVPGEIEETPRWVRKILSLFLKRFRTHTQAFEFWDNVPGGYEIYECTICRARKFVKEKDIYN
ncbi:MAG: hypothetical protein P8Y09_08495 [Deltaproteobacteria bacterium]